MALLLTFISGLFFLIGIIIYNIVKNKNKLTVASMACASIVITGLIVFDLIPEILEIDKWWIFLFVIIGLFILIVVDKLVPHHEHHHHENDEDGLEHQEHLKHISVVTIMALLLHNMIEGMALYSVTSGNYKSGLLMLVGIGLHNLPFGFQIASYNRDKKNGLLLVFLVLSGFFGGIIFSVFGNLNEILTGIIIALTMGMLLHILIFELLHEVKENIKKKESIYGIIIGMILLIIINLI